eukprot:2344979-Amphidinium_carterae.1
MPHFGHQNPLLAVVRGRTMSTRPADQTPASTSSTCVEQELYPSQTTHDDNQHQQKSSKHTCNRRVLMRKQKRWFQYQYKTNKQSWQGVKTSKDCKRSGAVKTASRAPIGSSHVPLKSWLSSRRFCAERVQTRTAGRLRRPLSVFVPCTKEQFLCVPSSSTVKQLRVLGRRTCRFWASRFSLSQGVLRLRACSTSQPRVGKHQMFPEQPSIWH